MKTGTDLLATMGQNLAAKRQGTAQTPIRHGQPQVGAQVPRPGTMPTAIEDVRGSGDDDLLAQAGAASASTGEQTPAATTQEEPTVTSAAPTVDNRSAQPSGTQVEPAGGGQHGDWTLDSMQAEMRKAREEAKRSRLELRDTVDRLQKEYQRKLEEIQSATKPLEDQARELAELRVKEADKKRSLEERIAARDQALADREHEIRNLKEAHNRELFQIRAAMEELQAEVNVQNQFYQDKMNEELSLIPDKFKSAAERMIRGCDSVREAVEVLREARDGGLFRDKTIQVSHAVPGVDQGARLSGSAVRQEQREKIDKMTSTEKIGLALQGLKNNPIYKQK